MSIPVAKEVTTLGRGGSDATAVALAAALGADVCEIYTDVDGVFTADPRVVADARKLDEISFEEMLELAGAGAGVLMARSVEFGRRYNIPIHVRSSFHDGDRDLGEGEDDGRADHPRRRPRRLRGQGHGARRAGQAGCAAAACSSRWPTPT